MRLWTKPHLMRRAGRFSRRLRGYARAHRIPVVDCRPGEDKHRMAEEYLEKTKNQPRGVSHPGGTCPSPGMGCEFPSPFGMEFTLLAAASDLMGQLRGGEATRGGGQSQDASIAQRIRRRLKSNTAPATPPTI